jgi:hypothetical protein
MTRLPTAHEIQLGRAAAPCLVSAPDAPGFLDAATVGAVVRIRTGGRRVVRRPHAELVLPARTISNCGCRTRPDGPRLASGPRPHNVRTSSARCAIIPNSDHDRRLRQPDAPHGLRFAAGFDELAQAI